MPHVGRQTMQYDVPVRIRGRCAMAGKKESEGPLGDTFDAIFEDDLLGQDSWEAAEHEMVLRTIRGCLEKAGITEKSVNVYLGGDLNNQIIAAGFAARALGVPFVGLYGACSTMIESMIMGAALVSAGYMKNAVCCASSHFCTAERQFRYPLELGNQRPPSAQWTATASGAVLLDTDKKPSFANVTHGTVGRMIDRQIKDANHMGAAMAPAVADLIQAHFEDTSVDFSSLDMVVTGDLGWIGRNILVELLRNRGIPVPDEKLIDCGGSLYYREQDTHAGGSGCGCIASVGCGWIMNRIENGELKNILMIGSGAMLSPTSTQQGESIPGIAYGVRIQREETKKGSAAQRNG